MLGIATVLGLGLCAGALSALPPGLVLVTVLLALAAVCSLAAVTLWRFEWLVPAVLAVRSSLDVLAPADGGALDPALLLTGVFAIASVVWLIAQHRAGRWRPLSLLSQALFGLFGVCVLSALSSQQPLITLLGSLKVGSGVLMFAVLEQYVAARPDAVRRIVTAVLLSLPVPLALGTYQLATGQGFGDSELLDGVSRVQGTFVHPSPFADYLVLVLALLIPVWPLTTGGRRLAVSAGIGGASALLIATYTRSAWLAVIVFVAYLGLRGSKATLLGLCAALVAVAAAVPSVVTRLSDLNAEAPAPGVPPNSFSWRLGYWQEIVALPGERLMTGIGFDMTRFTTASQLDPHSVWVQSYVEMGVLGVCVMLLVALGFTRAVRERLRAAQTPRELALAKAGACAGLGLLVLSIGENLLTQSYIYWYAAAAVSVGLSAGGREDSAALRSPTAGAPVETPS